MKKAILVLALTILSAVPTISYAGWQNIETKIDKIVTYVDRDHILIVTENLSFPMPEACNNRTIAIDASVPLERRQQALSMLLSAQARDTTVKLVIRDDDCVPWTSGDTLYLKLIKIVTQ